MSTSVQIHKNLLSHYLLDNNFSWMQGIHPFPIIEYNMYAFYLSPLSSGGWPLPSLNLTVIMLWGS